MLKRKRSSNLGIVIVSLFLFLSVLAININNQDVLTTNTMDIDQKISPHPSYVFIDGPLHFKDSADIESFKSTNTLGDSYVDEVLGIYTIQNIQINANDGDYGIFLDGLANNIIFNNVSIVNVGVPTHEGVPIVPGSNIYFNYTNAGLRAEQTTGSITVQNCYIGGNYFGIYVIDPTAVITVQTSNIYGSTAAGIYIDGGNNHQIVSNHIYENYNSGIIINDTTNVLIEDNNMYENDLNGIRALECISTTIKDNGIWGSSSRGIRVVDGNNNDIVYNDVSYCGTGISVLGGDQFVNVSRNTATYNQDFGIRVRSAIDVELKNNIASNNGKSGISLENNLGKAQPSEYEFTGGPLTNGEYITLPNPNDLDWNLPIVSYQNDSFYAPMSLNVTMDGTTGSPSPGEAHLNTASDRLYFSSSEIYPGSGPWQNSHSIFVFYSYAPNADIISNTANNNGLSGIFVSGCNNTLIQASSVSNNGKAGIKVVSGGSNTIQSNILGSNNYHGLFIEDEVSTNILNNDFSENIHNGITIQGNSDNVYLLNNDMLNNGNNGVEIDCASTEIIGGIIQYNQKNGILIEGDYNTIHSSVEVKYNELNGISITGNHNNITSITLSSNFANGLQILGNNNFIRENTIENNSLSGIYLQSEDTEIWSNDNINSNELAGIYVASGSRTASIFLNQFEDSALFFEPDTESNLASHHIEPNNQLNGELIRYWIDFPGYHTEDFDDISHFSRVIISEEQTFEVVAENYLGSGFTSSSLFLNDRNPDRSVQGDLDLENKFLNFELSFDVYLNFTSSSGSCSYFLHLLDKELGLDSSILSLEFNVVDASTNQWRIGAKGSSEVYTYPGDRFNLNQIYTITINVNGGSASINVGGTNTHPAVSVSSSILYSLRFSSILPTEEGRILFNNMQITPIEDDTSQIIIVNSEGFVIEDMDFENGNIAIEILNSNDITIRNVNIENQTMYGLYIYNSNEIILDNIKIDSAKVGIHAQGDDYQFNAISVQDSIENSIEMIGKFNTLNNINVSNSGNNGILIDGEGNMITADLPVGSSYSSNIIDSENIGVLLTGFSNTIKNVYLSNNGYASIQITDQTSGTIENCKIEDTGITNMESISIIDSTLITIKENEITNPNAREVLVQESTYVKINDNLFGYTGIFFNGSAINYYDTHDLFSNQLGITNPKPILFYNTRDEIVISPNCNQLILVNTNSSYIRDFNFQNTYIGIQLYYSNYNSISGTQTDQAQIANSIYTNVLLKNSNGNKFEYIDIDSQIGFILLDSDNNYISDVNFDGNSRGIYGKNTDGTIIYNCQFSSNTIAVELDGFSNNEISFNTITASTDLGFELKGGSDSYFAENIFEDVLSYSTYAIRLTQCQSLYFRDTEFSNIYQNLIKLINSNNNILQSQRTSDINLPITLVDLDSNSDHNTLDRIYGDYSSTTKNAIAINIEGNYNHIFQGEISNAHIAVLISNGNNNLVEYIRISNCTDGIRTVNARYVTVRFSYIRHCTNGISMTGNTRNSLITRNQFRDNYYGIYLVACDTISITHNYICNNNFFVIQVSSASITESNTVSCSGTGDESEDRGLIDTSDPYNITRAELQQRVLSITMMIALAGILMFILLGTSKFKLKKSKLHMAASD